MAGDDTHRIIKNIVSGIHSGTVNSEPEADDINLKDNVRRIAIGSDHGGFKAKEKIKNFLKSLGYRVTDVGTDSKDSVDYPNFAVKVAQKVAS